eukprot:scaffold39175_cov83-Cyclotella_meneghiniana.AAC.1
MQPKWALVLARVVSFKVKESSWLKTLQSSCPRTHGAWTQIVENCKRPPQVTDAAGNLVNQAAFHIGAKSLHRLKVAAIAIEYYAATNRALTAQAMQWDTTLKNFEVQWKAIKDAKDGDKAETPMM